MTDKIIVSIVIPTINRKDKLSRMIASILSSDFDIEKIEIIVVDNGSNDGTQESLVKNFPEVKLLQPQTNLMCGGSRNYGAEIARGEYIFFIDDDNVLDKSCIRYLVEHLETNKNDGVVAPIMLDYNQKSIIWCAGAKLSKFGKAIHLYSGKSINDIKIPEVINDVDYFPNFYVIRKSLKNAGLTHNTSEFPHNWTELDYCINAKKMGYGLATITHAITWHDIGYKSKLTRISPYNAYDQPRSRILLIKKYEKNFFIKLYFYFIMIPLAAIYTIFKFYKQKEEKPYLLMKKYFYGLLQGIRTKTSTR